MTFATATSSFPTIVDTTGQPTDTSGRWSSGILRDTTRAPASGEQVGQELEEGHGTRRVRDPVAGRGLAVPDLDGDVVGTQGAEGVLVGQVVAEVERGDG